MSVVLVFLLVVIGFSLWWLLQQRVLSRPWLEVGPDPLGGPAGFGIPTGKVALGVLLAVVGALFALFASAYFMRMELADWRQMPVPSVVWINTVLLVLASILLHCAVAAARSGDRATLRLALGAGGIATLAFIAGQLAAWQALAASGHRLTSNPADSFFYLLTGLHALHLLGGLVALGATVPRVWRSAGAGLTYGKMPPFQEDRSRFKLDRTGRATLRLELCATYWHFLLLVWLGLLVLFTGTAAEMVAICRQILT